MRAVVLDGSEKNDAALGKVRAEVGKNLAGMGWQVSHLPLCDMEIAPCRGCRACWTRTPGQCVLEDQGRQVLAALCSSDLAILLSPVVFGGFGAVLKTALDRCLGFHSPFVERCDGRFRHKARYSRKPALLTLGLLTASDGDSQRVFHGMVSDLAWQMQAPRNETLVLFSRHSQAATAQQVREAFARVTARR
ncbi:MAG: NAD(P)H-dependent oxidoreductase [Thermodesulfobacteriota bacterium]